MCEMLGFDGRVCVSGWVDGLVDRWMCGMRGKSWYVVVTPINTEVNSVWVLVLKLAALT